MDLNSLKALKFKGFKMLKGILVRFKYSEMCNTQIFLTNKYKSIPNSRQRTHISNRKRSFSDCFICKHLDIPHV